MTAETNNVVRPPTHLQADTAARLLRVTWEKDHVGQYPMHLLRCECRCAHCVDEWTGRRLLDISKVPQDITIKNIQVTGNYAIKILWSDGHDTGLYTWQRLRDLCPCERCAASRATATKTHTTPQGNTP